jgi:hypothetical protein
VKGILPDAHGNLWLSTDKGLTRFHQQTKAVKVYTVKEGLLNNTFLSGVYYKTREGRFLFGGVNGCISFHPDSIKDNRLVPPVVITDFKVFGQSLPPRIPDVSSRYAQEPLPVVILHHRAHFFSFEFVALDYTAPEKNQYAYKIGRRPSGLGVRRHAALCELHQCRAWRIYFSSERLEQRRRLE